jgi:glutathionyl-hydroquinone reductase
MGLLVNGIWNEEDQQSQGTNGRFVRLGSQFRHWVTNDGSTEFPAERGGITFTSLLAVRGHTGRGFFVSSNG